MVTWTTKEGGILRVSEMSTPHIKNCIKMLERNYGDIFQEGYYSEALDGVAEEMDNLKKELEHRERIKLVLREEGIIK